MEKRNSISYSFEDIKRYRQGLMSNEEMHAFEKASMEDPFLADALEGYMQADESVASQHVSNISEKISGNQKTNEQAVIVPMQKKSFAMWRVAAMLIVIAGAGLITYKILNKPAVDHGSIAEITPSKYPAQTPTEATPNTTYKDSTSKIENDKSAANNNKNTTSNNWSSNYSGLTVTKPETNGNAPASTENKKRSEDYKADSVTFYNVKPGRELVRREAKEENAPATVAEVSNAPMNKTISNEIRGTLIAPTNEPLANTNFRVANNNKQVVTDNEGNFVLNSKDTVVKAVITSGYYANTSFKLKANTNNTINIGTIKMAQDPSFEVTVTGLGTSRKKVADTTLSKPEGGWQSFQEYVANKLNQKIDTTAGTIRSAGGRLELEFYVDANGVPKDFKVLNSTNPTLNQQAIDAVKKGPRWTSKNKKTRILIKF